MKSIEDDTYQLILTDPPYDFPQSHMSLYHEEFLRICKGDILIFCPPENQWKFEGVKYLFWNKATSTKNYSKNYGRFVEVICRYEQWGSKFNSDLHWSNYTGVYNDLVTSVKKHPYKKPNSLIERFILIHSNENDSIFDPFAGSGTVEEIANKLGRKCDSCEIGNEKGEGRIL